MNSTAKKLVAELPVKSNGNGHAPKLPEAKALPPIPPLKKADEKTELAPLDDRLHRLNMLFDLQAKHAKLVDSEKRLKDFVIKNDKEASRLELTDDEDNEFVTSNPFVIAEVVALLKKTIKERKEVVAAQIIL